jgi:beta-1,4-mannosyl-glycoprotein beta-1,4-N-acetylglucosaminyltransferase
MKIIDCFMFYNELDILKIRLEELYNVVDYIIIIEATITHNNTPKPLYFNENKHLFSQYADKIIHYVTDFSTTHHFVQYINTPNDNWFRENYQRECAQIIIKEMNLNDNDIIITTDCDEIPKRSIIESIKNGNFIIQNEVYSIEMVLYYYNIELTTARKWYHAKLLNYNMYKKFNLLTDIRFSSYTLLPDAGYHLSYFGDVDFIKTKLESFAESIEYTKEKKETTYLEECYKNSILHFNGEQLIFKSLSENDNVPRFFKK